MVSLRTPSSEIEADWKARTAAGNVLFAAGRAKEAVADYAAALALAGTLNRRSDCPQAAIPSVQIFIISCRNLAHAHLALGMVAEADAFMRRSVHFLIHLIEEEATEPALARMAQRELGRAMMAYAAFAHGTNLAPQSEELFRILRQVRGARSVVAQRQSALRSADEA